MSSLRPSFIVQLPNQTPVIQDMSPSSEDWAFGITPGSGANTIKAEISFSQNAGGGPGGTPPNPNANWFPIVGTGFTAGVTAAGVATYFSTTCSVQALRFTRTVAGAGTDTIEICT